MCLQPFKNTIGSAKQKTVERGLFGCFLNRFQSLFHRHTFRCTLGNNTKLCRRHVSSARKSVIALPALPDTNAYTLNLHETTLRTPVLLLQPCNSSHVPLSDG